MYSISTQGGCRNCGSHVQVSLHGLMAMISSSVIDCRTVSHVTTSFTCAIAYWPRKNGGRRRAAPDKCYSW